MTKWFWEFELTWWFDSEKLNDKGFVIAKDEVGAMKQLVKHYGDTIDTILYLKACQESVFSLSESEKDECRFLVTDKKETKSKKK